MVVVVKMAAAIAAVAAYALEAGRRQRGGRCGKVLSM